MVRNPNSKSKNDGGSNVQNLKVILKWATDIQEAKPENYLLLDSQEVMIYDFELKLDHPNEHGTGTKAKILYGSKVF